VGEECPGPGVEVEPFGAVDLDLSNGGLDPTLAEVVDAPKGGHLRVTLQVRPGRQVDGDVDRTCLAEQAETALLRRLDQQPGGFVLDPSLFRGPDVLVLGRVARPDVDDCVDAVARGDPNIAGEEVDRDRDGLGHDETGHDDPFGGVDGCPGTAGCGGGT